MHFEIAFKYVILNEGKQSDHPTDKGGLTNWGITEDVARSHRCILHPNGVDPKKVDLNLAKHIYLEDYWEHEGIESPNVAVKLFDMGVNFGIKTVNRYAQMAANDLVGSKLIIDGILGKSSCAVINKIPYQEYLDHLEYFWDDRYWDIIYNSLVHKFGKKAVNETQAVFGKGWFRRSNKRFYVEE